MTHSYYVHMYDCTRVSRSHAVSALSAPPCLVLLHIELCQGVLYQKAAYASSCVRVGSGASAAPHALYTGFSKEGVSVRTTRSPGSGQGCGKPLRPRTRSTILQIPFQLPDIPRHTQCMGPGVPPAAGASATVPCTPTQPQGHRPWC